MVGQQLGVALPRFMGSIVKCGLRDQSWEMLEEVYGRSLSDVCQNVDILSTRQRGVDTVRRSRRHHITLTIWSAKHANLCQPYQEADSPTSSFGRLLRSDIVSVPSPPPSYITLSLCSHRLQLPSGPSCRLLR